MFEASDRSIYPNIACDAIALGNQINPASSKICLAVSSKPGSSASKMGVSDVHI
ncbi:MAG TPA: hypothetical protein VIQ31_19550 [Phormidium sp.]